MARKPFYLHQQALDNVSGAYRARVDPSGRMTILTMSKRDYQTLFDDAKSMSHPKVKEVQKVSKIMNQSRGMHMDSGLKDVAGRRSPILFTARLKPQEAERISHEFLKAHGLHSNKISFLENYTGYDNHFKRNILLASAVGATAVGGAYYYRHRKGKRIRVKNGRRRQLKRG